MPNKWKIRLILAACFISGLYLSVHTWGPQLTSTPFIGSHLNILVSKFGDSLLVASLLALIVDAAAKKELLETFTKNVSIHIEGRLLPEHLRQHMAKYLQASLVRTNWNLTFTIAHWPGHPEYVQVTTVSEYEIENRSTSTEKYRFHYEVENSWFPEIAESKLHRACVSIAGEKKLDLSGDLLQQKLKVEPDCKLFEHEQPIPSSPHPTCRFLTEATQCFKDGFSPFVPPVAVLGTTVTVYYPKDEFRVAMYVSTKPSAYTLEKTELANATVWHIKEPLLPGQCVFTRWERIAKARSVIFGE